MNTASKTTLRTAFCLTLAGASVLLAQPSFTKITTGPVATDIEPSQFPSWWDYDNDGWLDLYVANLVPGGSVTDSVYHNNGDHTFSKVTNSISTQRPGSFSGAVGDYNNDGLTDLLVVQNIGACDLFRNDGGGHFTRLTRAEAGSLVGDANTSMDAGWADYDRDGFIDLFMATASSASGNNYLYRNDGDGTFTRMTANQVGMVVGISGKTGPCAWVDFDNDGWPDLWVGTGMPDSVAVPMSGKQYLYHNNGDGTFSQVFLGSLASNVAKGVGIWGDYDNDGYLDAFLTSFTGGVNSLHHNLAGQTFTNVAASAGVEEAIGAFAAACGDYDNDGFLDLIVFAYSANDQSRLYHNNGDGTFTSVDEGDLLWDGEFRVGAAWADYDNDGFLDLFISCGDWVPRQNLLYHNNGNSNHWLEVKLAGTASNRAAIGAKVRVNASLGGRDLWQVREISGNSGWSGGPLLAHFGLGDATVVSTLRIEWPSGIVQTLTNVAPNQILTITEHQPGVTNVPGLTVTKPAAGPVQLTATGQTNLRYVFEASSDLAQWTKIAVRTNLTGTVDYTPAASSSPQRFYRVVVP